MGFVQAESLKNMENTGAGVLSFEKGCHPRNVFADFGLLATSKFMEALKKQLVCFGKYTIPNSHRPCQIRDWKASKVCVDVSTYVGLGDCTRPANIYWGKTLLIVAVAVQSLHVVG